MTNALAVYEQMSALSTAAQALHQSGFFKDVTTQAQAMVKVMAGAEIGLPPFASMSGIHIVQGKPVLGANLIATLVKNDPRYDYRVARADVAACILTWYEGGQRVGESSFTIEEAQAAQLAGKDNWKKYASDMLFARALTRGARRYAPGIFGGAPIYTPEEMGVETDEEGHVIEGEIVTPPATNGKPRAAQAEPVDIPTEAIRAEPAGNFVKTAAELLQVAEDTIRERMKRLGYTAISGKREERVKMFNAIRDATKTAAPAAQADWLDPVEPQPQPVAGAFEGQG